MRYFTTVHPKTVLRKTLRTSAGLLTILALASCQVAVGALLVSLLSGVAPVHSQEKVPAEIAKALKLIHKESVKETVKLAGTTLTVCGGFGGGPDSQLREDWLISKIEAAV